MDKSVAVAVNDSRASRQMLDYLARLAGRIPALRLTLVNVQPAISLFITENARKDPKLHDDLARLGRAHREASQALLAVQRDYLISRGFDPDRIDAVSLPHLEGLAKTILDYSQAHRVDAIVAGRRGASSLKKTLMGSVTADLAENTRFLPLWIVDGEVPSDRILVAVDGSESALRAVDHVSYLFKDNREIQFHLFHARPRLLESCAVDSAGAFGRLERIGQRGARHCIDHFLERAMELFHAAGIRDDQVHLKTTENLLQTGKAIIQEARSGDFGTIVIGRRGIGQSFFTGSVSRYVINRTENLALWLVS